MHLETFLGGMETRHRLRRSKRFSPLKPSLVEWKLGFHLCIRFPEATALETFLNGLDKELERSCPKNPRDTRKSSGKAS